MDGGKERRRHKQKKKSKFHSGRRVDTTNSRWWRCNGGTDVMQSITVHFLDAAPCDHIFLTLPVSTVTEVSDSDGGKSSWGQFAPDLTWLSEKWQHPAHPHPQIILPCLLQMFLPINIFMCKSYEIVPHRKFGCHVDTSQKNMTSP